MSEPLLSPQAGSIYWRQLNAALLSVTVNGPDGRELSWDDGISALLDRIAQSLAAAGRLLFVGNGGSATIASHMAIDFLKAGGVPALAFNDAAALTCLGNDCGYEQVFARQLSALARAGDLLIAISSSGRSPNILAAVAAAQAARASVVTLSGFTADNPLRRLGSLNFYIDSASYGLVEIAHLGICHAALDILVARAARAPGRERSASGALSS